VEDFSPQGRYEILEDALIEETGGQTECRSPSIQVFSIPDGD
jgi:hypothetical protein